MCACSTRAGQLRAQAGDRVERQQLGPAPASAAGHGFSVSGNLRPPANGSSKRPGSWSVWAWAASETRHTCAHVRRISAALRGVVEGSEHDETWPEANSDDGGTRRSCPGCVEGKASAVGSDCRRADSPLLVDPSLSEFPKLLRAGDVIAWPGIGRNLNVGVTVGREHGNQIAIGADRPTGWHRRPEQPKIR